MRARWPRQLFGFIKKRHNDLRCGTGLKAQGVMQDSASHKAIARNISSSGTLAGWFSQPVGRNKFFEAAYYQQGFALD